MEHLNLNNLLNREKEYKEVKTILNNLRNNTDTDNILLKRGIYIYGSPGSGKTNFITNILKELDYDIIKYDAGDIRNKSIIETITKNNMSDKNIISMFHKKIKKIAIIMDEIDGMNSGDKGGINSLIKIMRPKKTKKQRLEEISLNPIICIGNYHVDKKIKELMKVCHVIELKTPNTTQILKIFEELNPSLISIVKDDVKDNIIKYMQGDLRKIKHIYELYKSNKDIFKNNDIIEKVLLSKIYDDDSRKITKNLINNNYTISDHLTIMNETDRTIVGLLWHENIVDALEKYKKEESIPFYLNVLDNMCFADYIDRITFQKQIWQFNELSSLIKTFKNNKLYHDTFNGKIIPYNPTEVRFTKVLTKYSTEYNNSVFIQNLCQNLSMDQKDVFAFFLSLKKKYSDIEIIKLFENSDITKLEINRIYRYLERNTSDSNIEQTIDKYEDDDES